MDHTKLRVRALKQHTPISPRRVTYLVDENLRDCDIFEEAIRGARPNFWLEMLLMLCVRKNFKVSAERCDLEINIRVKKWEQ